MNYQQIYDQIIEKAKSEGREKGKGIYYEAHHIIPVCLGGDGKTTQWKYHPNIVLLTAREHFLVHWILVRIHPASIPLTNAFMRMCTGQSGNQERYTCSSYAYQEAKEQRSRTGRSKETIEKIKNTKRANPRKHTQEEKDRISKTLKGKPKSTVLNYRKPKSLQHKLNISKARLNAVKEQCPHCGEMYAVNVIARWHYSKCKKFGNLI